MTTAPANCQPGERCDDAEAALRAALARALAYLHDDPDALEGFVERLRERFVSDAATRGNWRA